ncbi:hypothetical protein D3C72_1261100 [compost metagenome]
MSLLQRQHWLDGKDHVGLMFAEVPEDGECFRQDQKVWQCANLQCSAEPLPNTMGAVARFKRIAQQLPRVIQEARPGGGECYPLRMPNE